MPLTAAEATSLNAALAADVAKFTSAAPPPPRTLYFSYFGDEAGNAASTADHVNMVFIPAWGALPTNWPVIAQRNIEFLTEARTAGISSAIVDLSYLVFTGTSLNASAGTNVASLLTQFRAAGVLTMVRAFYPIDEPDINGISDATLTSAIGVIRQTALQFPELAGVQIWEIYGQNGTPGMAACDAVGRDNYGAGAGALTWYNSLPAGKKKVLVPGGANPWKNDPTPFVTYALADPLVVCVMAFLWVDYAGGQGINDNGMAPAYKTAGQRILAQK